MAPPSGAEHQDPRAHHVSRDSAPRLPRHPGPGPTVAPSPLLLSALAGHGLGGRANAPARQATLQRLQQTGGNRAVQRYVGRSVPIQRCGATPCGCAAEEKTKHALMESPTDTAVQRSPGPFWEPTQATTPTLDHNAGDDWWGPNSSHFGTNPDQAHQPNIGGSQAIGGITSYGCYCGPGGDPVTGSRCGVGAPAVDAMDEQCRQHDSNYGHRGVDSATRPGFESMFTPKGMMMSEDADRQLANSVDDSIDADPSRFSSGSRLYGRTLGGIFGGRANIAHAMRWGGEREDEAVAGVSGAYDDASSWLGNRSDEATTGVSNFVDSLSHASSAGDVLATVGGGLSDATSWLGNTASQAAGGVTGALGSAAGWLGNTASQATEGAVEAGTGAARWAGREVGAVADVAGD